MSCSHWLRRLAPLTLLGFARLVLPLAAPATLTGCTCAERGGAVVLDAATVAREPAIFVEGDACSAQDVVCMHRDSKDRCDTYWIDPPREGTCTFSARFADGTRSDATILFDLDGEYPCRGNVRPRHDGVARITSGG